MINSEPRHLVFAAGSPGLARDEIDAPKVLFRFKV